jgi:hypothetical protein
MSIRTSRSVSFMLKLHFAGLLSLTSQLAHAYPTRDRPLGAFQLSDLAKREDNEFYFAAIGDSWGVMYLNDIINK